MAKFRKRPVVIEAEVWPSNHPGVTPYSLHACERDMAATCAICHASFGRHGWCQTLEGGHIVCPGDYVITGVAGEVYPCKPGIFHATYEAVQEELSERER